MSPKRPSLADTMRLAAQAEPPPLPPIVASPARPEPHLPPKSDVSTKPTGFYAATRAGKKKVTAALDPTTHKQLKSLAVDKEMTTEALLAEAISDLLIKHGIKRSA